jgi:CPA1 family monovalent cation:H+ antiporter
MTMFDVAAVLLSLAALLAYVNFRTLRMPSTIAMLVAGLFGAAAIMVSDRLFPSLGIAQDVERLLGNLNFSSLLLNGMLGFLLFAGALTVDFQDLRQSLGSVLTLATVGVLISTALIGAGSFFLFPLADVFVPFVYCLVFGALISPTDPVAVVALMNELQVPRRLQINFTGESLLNDGVGVVVFTVLLAVATAGTVSATQVAMLFAREVLGGCLLGMVAGLILYYTTRSIDEPNIEVQLSVAMVTALIAVAAHLHVSGPLGCVVAGIFVGSHARHVTMRDATAEALDRIWSFADHLMNAVLFLLIGLEAAVFGFASWRHAAVIAAIIALVVVVRWISVAIPLSVLRRFQEMPRGMIRILTWGGLRGGISLALALSLPRFDGRQAVLNATYAVVVFTIIVQGLTIGRVIEWFGRDVIPGERA